MSNKKYLCVFRSASGNCEPKEKPTPAQMQAMYDKFNAWKEQFADNIYDMGGKLTASGAVVSKDKVTDGPFTEIKEIIGGYMIVEAESLEQAIEVVQKGPGGNSEESSVEIREISAS